jgi:methionyl-tRNA synthetase
MAQRKFYITTPIYYPSSHLHIGHAYTTVYCDTLARWHRLKGEDVFFLTGSDEHGQKIERAAQTAGKTPLAYVDEIVATFQALWQRLNISCDDFIRTSEPRHHRVVQAIFKQLYDQGDIYKSVYKGWYCTPCESFCPETRLVDGNCPDCGRPVEEVEEESYFFRMSKYAPALLAHIEAHPEFIQPGTRRNEMVSFIKQGLEDLCVSRTTHSWGIPVPIDEGHVIYVWIDALSNYLTAIGYLSDEATYSKWWPADVHVVGKDILRFHTIIWPCILMALGVDLPKQVYGHGWVVLDSGKMSKSKGNVVDPNVLIDEFGADAIRYFLLREVAYGQDAKYSKRGLIERINADLANDLGNAYHRSLSMLERFCDGIVPAPGQPEAQDLELRQLAEMTVAAVDQRLAQLEANTALTELWRLVGAVNKYIDTSEPWSLAKDPDKKERLNTVMYTVMECLRIVALLAGAFLPETGGKAWRQLGLENYAEKTAQDLTWGGLQAGTRSAKGEPLFPRIDVAASLAVEETQPGDQGQTQAPSGKGAHKMSEHEGSKSSTKENEATLKQPAAPQQPASPGQSSAPQAPKTVEKQDAAEVNLITIDDFAQVQLRLAQVEAAEKVKGADKLLKLQVSVGEEKRQIVAGIAKHYAPEDLVGRKIAIVYNLKPAKLRGEWSQGMLLAASDDAGNLALLTVNEDVASGAEIR